MRKIKFFNTASAILLALFVGAMSFTCGQSDNKTNGDEIPAETDTTEVVAAENNSNAVETTEAMQQPAATEATEGQEETAAPEAKEQSDKADTPENAETTENTEDEAATEVSK